MTPAQMHAAEAKGAKTPVGTCNGFVNGSLGDGGSGEVGVGCSCRRRRRGGTVEDTSLPATSAVMPGP